LTRSHRTAPHLGIIEPHRTRRLFGSIGSIANTGTESYTKFGKLPPSPEIEAHLNGLINGAPVASLVNPMVAKLFTNVEVH
jgi:hypothetical protein